MDGSDKLIAYLVRTSWILELMEVVEHLYCMTWKL
jgi:hypothetical protein